MARRGTGEAVTPRQRAPKQENHVRPKPPNRREGGNPQAQNPRAAAVASLSPKGPRARGLIKARLPSGKCGWPTVMLT